MKSKSTDGEAARNSTQQKRTVPLMNLYPYLQQRSANFTGASGLLGQNLAALRHQKLPTPVSY